MRVKPTWIELLVIVSIIGVLAGLMMPAGDFDMEHRYPPPASRHRPDLAGVAGEYYLGDGRGTVASVCPSCPTGGTRSSPRAAPASITESLALFTRG